MTIIGILSALAFIGAWFALRKSDKLMKAVLWILALKWGIGTNGVYFLVPSIVQPEAHLFCHTISVIALMCLMFDVRFTWDKAPTLAHRTLVTVFVFAVILWIINYANVFVGHNAPMTHHPINILFGLQLMVLISYPLVHKFQSRNQKPEKQPEARATSNGADINRKNVVDFPARIRALSD